MRPPASPADFVVATALTALGLVSMAAALVFILAVIGWAWNKVRRSAVADADEQWRQHLAGEYPIEPEKWKEGR